MFWIISNIAATVAIVLINKQIYTDHGFAFGNLLITFHLLVSALTMFACERFGLIERKAFPVRDVWLLAVSNWLSVMFVNLSLLNNSVGMYQILKLANIPVLCVVEYIFLNKTYAREILASLAVLIGGISVCTITDLSFNWLGFTFGALATLGTAWNQILAGIVQNKHEVRGASVLYWTAAPTSLLFASTIGVTDDTSGINSYVLTSDALFWIVLSCFIACWIHVSSLQVIGRASPLTFQVAGHLKTVLVFVFAFLILKEASGWKNAVGILVACCGMIWSASYLLYRPHTPPTALSSPHRRPPHTRYSYLTSRPAAPASQAVDALAEEQRNLTAAAADDDDEGKL